MDTSSLIIGLSIMPDILIVLYLYIISLIGENKRNVLHKLQDQFYQEIHS